MPFLYELSDAGFWLAANELPLRVECARLARQLVDRGVRTLGLLPARDDVSVPPAAVQVGRALAERSSGPVAVLDGQGEWMAPGSEAAGDDPEALEIRWLRDDLALMAPLARHRAAPVEGLRRIVSRDAFERLVVDLTGFEHTGDHVAACDVLDGVALVARSGRTRARDVERRAADLRGPRFLGVLLTGVP